MFRKLDRFSKPLFKAFAVDISGTIAVSFAVIVIPLIAAGSMALDMSNGSDMKTQLQAAADTAVLAAATRLAVGASDGDKEELAIAAFEANLSSYLRDKLTSTPEVDVNFATKTVSMTAKIKTGSLLSNLVTDELTIGVNASATVSPGIPICLMALNPHLTKSLHVQGTADLIADGCSVHVNSDNSEALYQGGSATGSAASFCVHGDYAGTNFTPTPRKRCMVENDPMASQFAYDWTHYGVDGMPCDYNDLPQINAEGTTYLEPGVYCGGLTIKKGTVQLEQGGIYIFRDGPLHVQAQGTLLGDEVAVLFDGDATTRLISQAGADIITSARNTGWFRGIAFGQNPESVPDDPNLVIGGGSIEINGILYFPEQALKITGNGDIGTTAAQFAILADTISIEGNGQLNIKIGQNYTSTGLPDLPEASEVVYLYE